MRIARILFVLLVLALIAEAGLRVSRFGWTREALGPWNAAPPWERLRRFDATGAPDPLPGGAAAWAIAPGEPVIAYRLNALGLREDREVGSHAAPGSCRILAFGDAYTFGYGVPVEQTWPRRLERWGRARGAPLEVLNAGFPNQDSEQQRGRLERLLPRLHPDVVVATFDWWNVPPEERRPERLARWSRGWWLANVEEKAVRAGVRVAIVDETFRVVRHASDLFPASGLARELEPLSRPPSALEPRWTRTRAALAGMAADARATGADFVLVVTPLDLQVDPARNALYRSERLPYPAHHFADIDYRAAEAMPEALRTFAAAARIPFLDTTPAFAAHGGARLFLASDYHAGAGGQRVFAREVARWLVRTRACATALHRDGALARSR